LYDTDFTHFNKIIFQNELAANRETNCGPNRTCKIIYLHLFFSRFSCILLPPLQLRQQFLFRPVWHLNNSIFIKMLLFLQLIFTRCDEFAFWKTNFFFHYLFSFIISVLLLLKLQNGSFDSIPPKCSPLPYPLFSNMNQIRYIKKVY
jgi:hypothetical protein